MASLLRHAGVYAIDDPRLGAGQRGYYRSTMSGTTPILALPVASLRNALPQRRTREGARGAEVAVDRSQRYPARGFAAALGSEDLHAAGARRHEAGRRPCCCSSRTSSSRPPRRAASWTRPRRRRRPCRTIRTRRRSSAPRGATGRWRCGVPPTSSRSSRSTPAELSGLDRGAPRERLRSGSSAARKDARALPPVGGLLSRVRAHRRSPHRLLRLWDEGGVGAELFGQLRRRLVPMVSAISSRPAADDPRLRQHTPAADQLAFGLEVIRRFGYDFNRGRQDLTAHPFMTKFSLGDVRITTRVNEHDLTDALFSTMHECGHALYEQGIDPSVRTPLGGGIPPSPREPVAALGEPRRAQPRLLGASLSEHAACVPVAAPGRASRYVLSRGQPGRAVAHPHRRGRGHLQPSRDAPVRSWSWTCSREPCRSPICREPGASASRRTWASRSRTTATASSRTCTGTTGRSAACSGATPSGTSSPLSSTRRRSSRIPRFPARFEPASSDRSTGG